MVRNLPSNFTRQKLLDLLDAEGFEGSYDFVYLPIDYLKKKNPGLGYAFLNFVLPEVADQFRQHFSGLAMSSTKVCEVTWSDSVQGLHNHMERYRNSPVMHESVPDELRPLLFRGMERVPFPAPTRTITAPRRWDGANQKKKI